LKPLERDGLVESGPDPKDRRSRILMLTAEGRALLAGAVPVWRRTHAAVDRLLEGDAGRLRGDLKALSTGLTRGGAAPRGVLFSRGEQHGADDSPAAPRRTGRAPGAPGPG
jgi:hypothetical protein